METITIAKVLGIYFMVSGVFVITHKKTLTLLLKDLFSHRAISYFIGVVLVFGGSALVLRGNVGTDSLSVFVMIMSWAILIKGVLYIFAPEKLNSMVRHWSRSAFLFTGVIIALLGVYLVFFLS